MPRRLLFILLICPILLGASRSFAQKGVNDTLMLGGIVVGQDTFAMVFLPEFEKTGVLPRYYAKQREVDARLRYNVAKVYPYAIVAAEYLKDVDVNLAKYADDKKKRKEYMKDLEHRLNQRFKGELENLTITQGQILVRLIDRQTGKNCYSIIRDLKGGFSAVIWQSVGLLFSNNLRREYDPYDRDKDIEAIVSELEANNFYRYKYQRQNVMMMQAKAK